MTEGREEESLQASAARLVETEEWLRLAIEASDTGLWKWDLRTDAVMWSPRCYEIHGISEDGFGGSGSAFFPLVYEEDRQRVEESVLRAVHDRQLYECEFRIVRPDGSLRWVANRGRATYDKQGNPCEVLGTITDITERKERDQQLERSQEQLRRNHQTFYSLLQKNPFGIYIVDADFRLQQVSSGARPVFVNVHPLLGRDFAEIIFQLWPEPFASEVIARFRHTLATGEEYVAHNTVQQRRDTDEEEAYDWRIERIELPDGQPGVVCYFYDLSERQRWEKTLRAKEEELQTLTDNSPDILTRFDRSFRHVFVNTAVERVTGRPRSHFIGKTNRELGMPLHLCELWEDAIERVFEQGQPVSLDFSHTGAVGEKRYAAKLVPEFGDQGEVSHVLGVTHDVTELTLAHEELRETEERLRLALTAAQAGVWSWHIPSGDISWSRENYALYGLDPEDGPPSYADWEQCLHPDDVQLANTAIQDALTGRAFEYRVEFRINHRLRGTRWLLGLGQVQFDAQHQPIRMSGLNLDITERKHFEQSIAEQDRKKDEFLATLAHELRNPLAPLRLGLDVLDLSADPDESSQTRHMMRRQLSQMVRLIDDLLDVSRINSGKVVLRRERLHLQSVLEAALEASRPQIIAARHDLTVDVPDEPLWLDADAARMTQVISNLLTNAAKYTPDGGEIVLRATEQNGDAVVSVRDNGLGIPSELFDEVFEMFAQVNQTLERAQGGLGIGLALVRRLVAMHGGSISVKSDGIGRGSTFTVKLPLAVGHQRLTPKATGTVTRGGEQFRILVVDDNVDGANSLSTLLKIHRHDVQTAFTGRVAVEIATGFQPDVVFLDIGLPDMSGHDVARQFREVFVHQPPVLVALTGWGSDEDRRRTEASGFNFHLTKPVEWPELQAILEQTSAVKRQS